MKGNKKKILFVLLEPCNPVQEVIQENFFKLAYLLSKEGNEVYFLCDVDKKKKVHKERILKSQCKLLDVGSCLRLEDKEKKIYTLDLSKERYVEENLKGFDVIYFYGMYLVPDGLFKKILRLYKELQETGKVYISYLTNKYLLNDFYLINKIFEYNKKSKTIIQVIDFLEPFQKMRELREGIEVYGPYEVKGLKMKSNYFNEFFYFSSKNLSKKSKDYDFVFGYNCTNDKRKKISEFCSRIKEDERTLLFRNDKFQKINNVINQQEYLNKISHSKFSLIVPSNDKSQFSSLRFLECISRRCIPLFLYDCNWQKYLEKYPDLYDYYLLNDLIVNYDCDINEKVKELDYEKLIFGLENLETYKKFRSLKETKRELLRSFESDG